ncbi:Hypothetical protein UVM_LOCUS342 [uncultured virus]|nr:Hypothetical protein UVM_LOCUS342 [uncultured virus]
MIGTILFCCMIPTLVWMVGTGVLVFDYCGPKRMSCHPNEFCILKITWTLLVAAVLDSWMCYVAYTMATGWTRIFVVATNVFLLAGKVHLSCIA